MKKIITFILIYTFGISAYAACASNSCSDEYVEMLYVRSGNNIVNVDTTGIEASLPNCTPASGKYLQLDLDDVAGREIYSTLLAAQMANKKVHFRLITNYSPCTIAYITLSRQ